MEPGTRGSYFDAEILFGAGCGDESEAKQRAVLAIRMHPGIRILTETTDVVSFRLESVDDFIASMHPTENLDEIAMFLAEREYMLHAVRHIWVCQPSVGE